MTYLLTVKTNGSVHKFLLKVSSEKKAQELASVIARNSFPLSQWSLKKIDEQEVDQ